jgi:hypothetical protein
MSMKNNIKLDIQKKLVPTQFRSVDLQKRRCSETGNFKVGNSLYTLASVRTNMANLCVDTSDRAHGYTVRRGAEPQFVKIARGVYSLVD